MNGERIVYADWLRVVASFFVIIVHVCAYSIVNVSVNSINFIVLNIFESISRFCVPIFVMISGIFFLNPNKQITIKSIYKPE